jgi:hypothetical protein
LDIAYLFAHELGHHLYYLRILEDIGKERTAERFAEQVLRKMEGGVR